MRFLALTFPQYLLVWAWNENDAAKYCLDGEALAFKEEAQKQEEQRKMREGEEAQHEKKQPKTYLF